MIWEIATANVPYDTNDASELLELLKDCWEPYAVTAHEYVVTHYLRRAVSLATVRQM